MMRTTEDVSQSALEVVRQIRDSIDAANLLALRGVHIEAKNDCTVLTGTVTSFYQKQMATELARRVPGAGQVVNLLEVPRSNCDNA